MTDKTLPYFDTLRAAEELKKAGASDKLSRAIVHVLGDAQQLLVTKKDLRWMELRQLFYVLIANGTVIGFLLKHLQ